MDTNWSSAKKVISPCPWRSNEETRKTKLHKRRGLVGAPIRTGPNANHQTNLGAPKKLPLPPLISTMSHELLNYAHALEDVVDHKTKWSHSNLVLQVQALWPKRSNDCHRIVTVMFYCFCYLCYFATSSLLELGLRCSPFHFDTIYCWICCLWIK